MYSGLTVLAMSSQTLTMEAQFLPVPTRSSGQGSSSRFRDHVNRSPSHSEATWPTSAITRGLEIELAASPGVRVPGPLEINAGSPRGSELDKHSSIDDSGASQQPASTNSNTSHAAKPSFPPAEYRDARNVPGTNQFIYPHAEIPQKYHDRYPSLVDLFKSAVDDHRSLKYHAADIAYTLKLCGSTTANAAASIIIFCTETIFDPLRTLFGSDLIRRHYQELCSTSRKIWPFSVGVKLALNHPGLVPFRLVYWRTEFPTKRTASETVFARGQSIVTMCGSTVTYNGCTSTLGLLISVDSDLYGLTVDHLFTKHIVNRRSPVLDELSTSSEKKTPEMHEDDTDWIDVSWTDDVMYEDLDSTYKSSQHTTAEPEPESKSNRAAVGPPSWTVSGIKVDCELENDASLSYLDWALIRFDRGYHRRPNAFHLNSNSTLHFIDKHVNRAETIRQVYMISGATGTRKGILIPGHSYIGSGPGQDLCKVVTLRLSDNIGNRYYNPHYLYELIVSGVIEGDCGSLVVVHNGAKFEALGYVVASNPLDEAYIVPLHDAFAQIQQALGAKELKLPDSGALLVDLVVYYSTTLRDVRMSEEAKAALVSAVRSGSIDIITMLQGATFQENWGAVEAILEAHFNASGQESRTTPLLEALLKGHKRTINKVMVTHHDIDEKTDLLLHAAKSGLSHLGMMLLSRSVGTEAQTLDKRQATPLHLACENGYRDFAQLLLEHGADIETTTCDSRRTTALHLAAENGHYEIVRVLVERGADTEAEAEDQTAMQLAGRNGHEAVVCLLLDWIADNQARTDTYQQHPKLGMRSATQYESAKMQMSKRDSSAAREPYDSAEEDSAADGASNSMQSKGNDRSETTSISEGWAPATSSALGGLVSYSYSTSGPQTNRYTKTAPVPSRHFTDGVPRTPELLLNSTDPVNVDDVTIGHSTVRHPSLARSGAPQISEMHYAELRKGMQYYFFCELANMLVEFRMHYSREFRVGRVSALQRIMALLLTRKPGI